MTPMINLRNRSDKVDPRGSRLIASQRVEVKYVCIETHWINTEHSMDCGMVIAVHK